MKRHWLFIPLIILSLCACNKDEKPKDNVVPESVFSDFNRRYPSSQGFEMTNSIRIDDGTSRIVFRDAENLQYTAVYCGEEWYLTQKEYDKSSFLAQLPTNIADSYSKLDIKDSRYIDENHFVLETTRKGNSPTQYDFHFSADRIADNQYYNNLDHHIVLDKDGKLMTVDYGYYENFDWWRNIDSSIKYLIDHFPEAYILRVVHYEGVSVFFISDNLVNRRVTIGYYDDWEWEETLTVLELTTVLPDYVMEEYNKYHAEHPELPEYSAVYYRCSEGKRDCYLLRMGTESKNTTLVVPVK